jgi:CheY-like chemotaxis protein
MGEPDPTKLNLAPSLPPEGKEKLSKRILLADDYEPLISSLAMLLRSQGYLVDTVENGQLLLDKLAANKYDLVITDYEMPLMTGLEALLAIKADDSLKDLPIIVYSGSYEIEGKVKMIGGIFLRKGEAISELKAVIKKVLGE